MRILALLIPVSIFASIDISFNPEIHFGYTADKPSWMSLVHIEDPYFSTLMAPFASLKISFDLLGGEVVVSSKFRAPYYSSISRTNLPSNAWMNSTLIEEAFWRYDDGRMKILIGRRKRKFGYMEYPLSIGDHVPFLDGLDFKSGIFSYHIYVLDPYLTREEKEIQCGVVPINARYAYCDPVKIYMAHFLDFEYGNLEFSVGESALFWGKTPTIELNPFMIWHFLYEEGSMNSQLISFGKYEVSNLSFRYEIVIDDVALPPYEPEDVKPTAIGYAIGLDYSDVDFRASVEYYHTDDWIYNREVPYSKFTARFLRVTNTRYYEEYTLGFPFGPGADLVIIRTKLSGFEMETGILMKKGVHVWSDYKSDVVGITVEPVANFTLKIELIELRMNFIGKERSFYAGLNL